ncbi:hypothetical protein OH492_09330 [Vibrio chagasii]|nr:hypothetical protein [Vibrio chagasii]
MGIIAIALRSIGFVAKLMYEAIEEVNATQMARRFNRRFASPLQVRHSSSKCQALSARACFVGISTFGESTVLGLVGAGGIGFETARIKRRCWRLASSDFNDFLCDSRDGCLLRMVGCQSSKNLI